MISSWRDAGMSRRAARLPLLLQEYYSVSVRGIRHVAREVRPRCAAKRVGLGRRRHHEWFMNEPEK
jgi:hypothetical protein